MISKSALKAKANGPSDDSAPAKAGSQYSLAIVEPAQLRLGIPASRKPKAAELPTSSGFNPSFAAPPREMSWGISPPDSTHFQFRLPELKVKVREPALAQQAGPAVNRVAADEFPEEASGTYTVAPDTSNMDQVKSGQLANPTSLALILSRDFSLSPPKPEECQPVDTAAISGQVNRNSSTSPGFAPAHFSSQIVRQNGVYILEPFLPLPYGYLTQIPCVMSKDESSRPILSSSPMKPLEKEEC